MLQAPPVAPARGYADALERVHAMQSRDDASILPAARTALLDHGKCVEACVVLLHGFTNNPAQYAEFAPMVHALGANVFVPRLPEHGDRNRLTQRLARITAQALLNCASEAVDIACGLGERVCLLGISSSGVLCAYFAHNRSGVSKAVAVSPAFAILKLPYVVSNGAGAAMRVLPNRFLWWDPRLKEHMRPLTAYPRFPTRGLGQTLAIAGEVYAAAGNAAPAGGPIDVIVNRDDPAVNNDVAARLVRRWNASRDGVANFFEFTDLPHNHDIIDPDNPRARTDIVYPKLLEAIRTI